MITKKKKIQPLKCFCEQNRDCCNFIIYLHVKISCHVNLRSFKNLLWKNKHYVCCLNFLWFELSFAGELPVYGHPPSLRKKSLCKLVQYCAKVMQMKFDELWSLFSQNFAWTFTQCRAKLRAKVHPQNEISWKYRAIFRKVKWKITLAKICGNKKELQRYTTVKA